MKRLILIVVVLGALSGCGIPSASTAREEAQGRWYHTRAKIAYGVAVEHLKVGQLDQARSKAQEALALDSNYADARVLLGKICIEQGNYVGAVAELGKVCKQLPRAQEPLYLTAVAQEKDGQLETALENYRKAQALCPSNMAPVEAATEVLIQLDRPQEARLYLEAFMDRAGNDPAMYELAGRLAFTAKDYDRAILCYQEAHDLDNANLRYREALAEAQFQAGKYADAADTLRELIETKDYSPSVGVYACLGDSSMALGNLVEARNAFRKATETCPNSAGVWVNLAKAALALNDPARAIAAARSALDIDRDHRDAAMVLGYALIRQGQARAAIKVLHDAAKSHPDSGMLQCVLGRAFAAAGDVKSAAQCYVQALQLEPDNTVARELLASVSGQTRETE